MNRSDQAEEAQRLLGSFERRQIDRRQFLGAAGALSAAAILAACSGSSGSSGNASGKNGKVTVPLYTPESDPGTMAFLAASKKEYEAQNPNVTISLNYISDATSEQFITNALRTRHDIGIFSPVTNAVPGWAEAGLLLPVDSIVSEVGQSDFIPGTRMRLSGHDWWMPYQKSSSTLWYREDVLDSVGIKAPPTTWDDWQSTLQEVHGKDGMVGYATTINDEGIYGLWSITPFVLQQGWDFFNKQGQLTFNKDACLQGVQRFCDLMKKYSTTAFANAADTDVTNAFVAGKAVFAWWTGRVGNTVAASAPKIAEVTGVAGPPPAGPFMQGQLTFGFGKGYCIDKQTQSPEHALGFLKMITTGQSAVDFALTVPGQPLPALNSVTKEFLNPNNPSVKANAYMANPKYRGWVSKMSQAVQYTVNATTQMGTVNNSTFAQNSNVCPFSSNIFKPNDYLDVMVQSVLLQGAKVEDAWKTACSGMDQAAKSWLSANSSWKPTG